MEKDLGEDELKELEDEIDSAVDRLFVENRKVAGEALLKARSDLGSAMAAKPDLEPAFNLESLSPPEPVAETAKPQPFSFGRADEFEAPFGFEPTSIQDRSEPVLKPQVPALDTFERMDRTMPPKDPAKTAPQKPAPEPDLPPLDAAEGFEETFDFEPLPPPAPAKPVAQPPPYLKSIDQLEAQLLSLEWEITGEKLESTRQEVVKLRDLMKEKREVGSVLGFMGSVLGEMVSDEQKIQPSMIKFLLDAKETIKLLFERENDREFEVYRQLARDGIEARFAGLKGVSKDPAESAAVRAAEPLTPPPAERPAMDWKKMEEGFNQWKQVVEKAQDLLQKIDLRLSELDKKSQPVPSPREKEAPVSMDVTVFRAFGKLYGVESRKIAKLFRLPATFQERWAEQPQVVLKDRVVALVDLKKTFPDEAWGPAVSSKLLIVDEGGEWKGLLVEEVLKRFNAPASERKENGKSLLGTVLWNDRARQVNVPVLDVKSL